MMKDQFIFIFKVLILSLLGSILIKYGAPFLPINETSPLELYSLISIFLPPLILGIILWLKQTKKIYD